MPKAIQNSVFIVVLAISWSVKAETLADLSEKHMNSALGKKYEKLASEFLNSNLTNIQYACSTKDLEEFSVYLKISENGKVVESKVSRESAETGCFKKNLGELAWPKPPFYPFVYGVTLYGEPGIPQFELLER